MCADAPLAVCDDYAYGALVRAFSLESPAAVTRSADSATEDRLRSGALASTSDDDILLDTHGRRHTYLRVSLTERCNLRCKYCMPAEGVQLTPSGKLLTADEVRSRGRGACVLAGRVPARCDSQSARLSVWRVSLWRRESRRYGSQVNCAPMRFRVCTIGRVLTAPDSHAGGEPTVRPDLEDIAARIGALPGLRDLGITTNGILLAKKLPGATQFHWGPVEQQHVTSATPLHLAALRAAGLTAVNISLDSLVPAKFELLTRRLGHDRVLGAVDAALDAGFVPVKVNCVVMRGINDDELLDFVALTRERPINVRFIEYMPFDGNEWQPNKMVSYAQMRAAVTAVHPHLQRLDDAPDDVAKNFRVPGHVGTVSFVTSMTNHFCAGCTRLRLLADGALKVCLFGASEVSLRDALRAGADDAELRQLIGAAVRRKKPAHAGIPVPQLVTQPNRPMVRIGG